MITGIGFFFDLVVIYTIMGYALGRISITMPMFFVIAGGIVGANGLGWISFGFEASEVESLTELTLALLLFADAATLKFREVKDDAKMPGRLLVVAFPLVLLFGALSGYVLFPAEGIGFALLLGAILAPTDAALGLPIFNNSRVPARVRRALNVESGLNDGICVPILFLFLALATDSSTKGSTVQLAMTLVAQQIGIGVAVGVGLTVLGGWLLKLAADRGWITESWRQLPVVALAVACFAVAQKLGGSGFIASFSGGLLFGGIAKHHKAILLLAAEGIGDTLALITWVVFGATVVGRSFGQITWEVVLYAILSLTLVRMLPVFLTLAGMNLRTDEKLFMGWFGPRGLASIVFAVIVINEHLPGGGTITITVACTIILSIVAHGLSAHPLVAALVARLKRSERG